MTRNQIEYNKLLETKRANTRNEELTSRRDEAAIAAKLSELGEASRHNAALEQLQRMHENELLRHNAATEEATLIDLNERQRSNRAQETLGQRNLAEVSRANRARETEATRSNLAREAETNRSNVERERQGVISLEEQQRSNLARETETHRANKAAEALRGTEIAKSALLEEQKLLEVGRHNRAMELKDYSTKVYQNQSGNSRNTKGINGTNPSGGKTSPPASPKPPSGPTRGAGFGGSFTQDKGGSTEVNLDMGVVSGSYSKQYGSNKSTKSYEVNIGPFSYSYDKNRKG